MATNDNKGQDKGDKGGEIPAHLYENPLINLRVWEAIEKEFGVITDVSLEHRKGYSVIHYTSNGEKKCLGMSGNNLKPMLVGFAYYHEALTSAPKLYKSLY